MNKKWDIEKVKELFKNRQCTLISEEYINNKQKLKYVAQCGHGHEITVDNFTKGKGDLCKACRYKAMGDSQRLDIDYVKQVFADNNCTLLSDSYKDNKSKLLYIAQCGHKNKLEFSKFQAGAGLVCNNCSKSIRYEFDYVFESFLNEGCYLLETEYTNCKTPMKYIAKCGHESYITFDAFQNSKSTPQKCAECLDVKKYTIEDVKRMLASAGCALLSEQYVPSEKISYIARCGHKRKIMLQKFINGQGKYCNKCARPKGENHHNYNSSLTDEERIQNRDLNEVIKWRNAIYKKDDYTCQKCGYDKGGNLNAHHIMGYNIEKERRFDIENGITLCIDCHNNFHRKYGYGNNTESQFKQWFDANTEVSNQIAKG